MKHRIFIPPGEKAIIVDNEFGAKAVRVEGYDELGKNKTKVLRFSKPDKTQMITMGVWLPYNYDLIYAFSQLGVKEQWNLAVAINNTIMSDRNRCYNILGEMAQNFQRESTAGHWSSDEASIFRDARLGVEIAVDELNEKW